MEIEWEVPAVSQAPHSKNDKTRRFIAALAERPGEWAVWTRTAKGSSGASIFATRYPQCEWTSRMNGDGTCTVYARWVGGRCHTCGSLLKTLGATDGQ